MPTQDYRLPDGRKVPGVTTVNKNIGWSTENLIRWANRQGLAGVDVRSRQGQTAANIGTLVHNFIEAEVLGQPTPPVDEEYRSRVEQGLESFRTWRRQTNIEIIGTELYGVDEEYETGWCLDALCKQVDGLSVMDYKSGKGPFPEHFLQVATYVTFFERLTGLSLCGAHVGRFSIETGIFHQVFFPRNLLDVGFKAWSLARGLHQYKPLIESYVR